MKTKSAQVGEGYLALVRQFPLVPIRTDRQLKAAYQMIDPLALKGTRPGGLTSDESNYLEVLCDLTRKYEQNHLGLGHGDPIDLLRALLDEQNMTGSDLGRLLGNRALGNTILRRQRELSKTHIAAICRFFKVSADLFMQSGSRRSAA